MKPQSMTLEAWVAAVAGELGLDGVDLGTEEMHIVLDLARDAAHQVQRPAAPLTTFLLGVAVGRGQALGAAAASVTVLATGTDDPGAGDEEAGGDEAGNDGATPADRDT